MLGIAHKHRSLQLTSNSLCLHIAFSAEVPLQQPPRAVAHGGQQHLCALTATPCEDRPSRGAAARHPGSGAGKAPEEAARSPPTPAPRPRGRPRPLGAAAGPSAPLPHRGSDRRGRPPGPRRRPPQPGGRGRGGGGSRAPPLPPARGRVTSQGPEEPRGRQQHVAQHGADHSARARPGLLRRRPGPSEATPRHGPASAPASRHGPDPAPALTVPGPSPRPAAPGRDGACPGPGVVAPRPGDGGRLTPPPRGRVPEPKVSPSVLQQPGKSVITPWEAPSEVPFAPAGLVTTLPYRICKPVLGIVGVLQRAVSAWTNPPGRD